MTDNIAIRPWMLAYTIIFGLMSIVFVYDDFGQYSKAYALLSGVLSFGEFTGNLLFSLGYVTPIIRTLWKFVFPIVIVGFIGTGIVDTYFIAQGQNSSPALIITVWGIGIALYSPTFRAHYLLGYGHEDG